MIRKQVWPPVQKSVCDCLKDSLKQSPVPLDHCPASDPWRQALSWVLDSCPLTDHCRTWPRSWHQQSANSKFQTVVLFFVKFHCCCCYLFIYLFITKIHCIIMLAPVWTFPIMFTKHSKCTALLNIGSKLLFPFCIGLRNFKRGQKLRHARLSNLLMTITDEEVERKLNPDCVWTKHAAILCQLNMVL